MHLFRIILLFVFVGFFSNVYAQQDVDFHLNAHLLPGKNILKVKRDFKDPYLWVLAQNNEIYRINSLTNVVEDFTPVFSAYSGFEFIDIAGRSKDTVFVATNSTNVIEYKTGTFKIIGSVNGIPGIVNGVALDLVYFNNKYIDLTNSAIISTNNGLCRYNFTSENITAAPVNIPTRIFETSYRTEMYFDGREGRNVIDSVQKVGVISFLNASSFVGELWINSNYFGQNIKSAYYNRISAYDDSTPPMYQFWATENGLFENNWNHSYSPSWSHRHFLKGIDITKITSIYGLKSFGNSMVRENLLIGSKQGLYFSNSKYQQYFNEGDGNTVNYSFFHFDDLGNIVINDISVNAITEAMPLCENGAWIATANGLYLIKPDYGRFSTTNQVQALQFQGLSSSLNEFQLCNNTNSVDLTVATAFLNNTIQWYKDGAQITGQSSARLNTNQQGEYYAILYDPCSTFHVETNRLKVSVTSTPVFTFNYPDVIENCAGTSAALKIEANNPVYQYRWYKDGVLNSNTSTTQIATQNGIYKAEISACNGTWVATKEVQVRFINLQQPIITASKPTYCIGEQALLSTNILTSNEYTINWYRNGTIISSNTNRTTLITDVAAAYTVSVSSNQIPCSKISPGYNVIVNPLPTLVLEKHSNTAFCDGEIIDLNATFNTGNVTWSTGAATPNIQVKNTGTYTATVSTIAGCTITKEINVTLFPKPKLNMPDAALCEFTNEQITLTAPTGFSSYVWNGQLGGRSYVVKSLGTVSLVVTDQNNCTASETINIASHCNTINMPNTFTPNGDGVNDTWEISGLNNDLKSSVTIFNRFGTVVFTSRGYPTPWNGEYQGRKLPMGTYYYIISTSGNKQILSGSITIIY